MITVKGLTIVQIYFQNSRSATNAKIRSVSNYCEEVIQTENKVAILKHKLSEEQLTKIRKLIV